MPGTVTRKSDHLFTAKNIKTASEILKTQLFFDLKFKSLFYKNDRKQPDLWSFFITFVAESSGLAIFWSWILTSFLADRSQNWSICIKIQIKLRYSVQKSSRSVCREARNLKNKKIKWRYLEAKWAYVGKSQL